jgi:hypothetical protein
VSKGEKYSQIRGDLNAEAARYPALAGLLALASTIISLIVVNAIISGLTIHRVYTYVLATIIIWITTALADMIGRRMVRKRRAEQREAEPAR